MNGLKVKSIFLFLSAVLLSNINADSDKQLFMQKYIKKDAKAYMAGKEALNQEQRDKLSYDVNLSSIAKKDLNNTNFDVNYTTSAKIKQQAEGIASQINTGVRSSKYTEKVNDYKDYILNDKQLNFKKSMGIYSKTVEQIQKNRYEGINYSNKYLATSERLIIAISSSVPKETIINYFKSLDNVHSDVVFVINGFIGNNPKFIKPTLNYISDLLNKNNKSNKTDKDRYGYRVDINPKIFMKYSIEQVPAVIFVKNYNPYSELQGNGLMKEPVNDEEVYISYGDSGIQYTLNKINKQAKSKTLDKLIKNIQKGFFNE